VIILPWQARDEHEKHSKAYTVYGMQARRSSMSEDDKHAREVANIVRVIRQEMGSHNRTLYGRKLGDACVLGVRHSSSLSDTLRTSFLECFAGDARHTFGLLDRDGNGYLSRDEFAEGLKRMDVGLTDAQLTEVLDAVDTDGNGTVEYEEFLALLQAGASAEKASGGSSVLSVASSDETGHTTGASYLAGGKAMTTPSRCGKTHAPIFLYKTHHLSRQARDRIAEPEKRGCFVFLQ
jgi:hypothetical protein